jgi:hypothetical protein
MKWFFNWLREKLDNTRYAKEEAIPQIGLASNRSRRNNILRESEDICSEPITFKMYKASGGWAIEFRQYDNRNDRVDTSLYVVTDENELGKHISQIITMEALKR